jgi:hypothetical protein
MNAHINAVAGRRGTETPKRVDVDVMILPRLLISAPNLVND